MLISPVPRYITVLLKYIGKSHSPKSVANAQHIITSVLIRILNEDRYKIANTVTVADTKNIRTCMVYSAAIFGVYFRIVVLLSVVGVCF